jgi:poly-gamma-glutamate synthesis protein (capsule biosynthesis protein)
MVFFLHQRRGTRHETFSATARGTIATMRAVWVLVAVGCSGGAAEPRPPPPPSAPDAAVPDAGVADAMSPDAAVVVVEPPPPEDLRKDSIELAFAGDVMFGRYKPKGLQPIRADEVDVWKYTRDILDSDFTMVNLETPILREPPKKSKYGTRMRFVATPERVATLLTANIDAVTLANNHAYDMHLEGVEQTPAVLDELGLEFVGAHRPEPPILRAETFEVEGWKVGFIAVTQMRNGRQREGEPELPYAEWQDLEDAVLPVVREARAAHDLLIVTVHWGQEYEDEPRSWMVSSARAWIDAGADAVIGHHPHVLQGIERYGDGLIAYSLGNFLFDNPNRKVVQTGVLRLRFQKDGTCLDEAIFHPAKIKGPQFAPHPAKGRDFKQVAGRMRTLSKAEPLQRTEWTIDGDRLTLSGTCE